MMSRKTTFYCMLGLLGPIAIIVWVVSIISFVYQPDYDLLFQDFSKDGILGLFVAMVLLVFVIFIDAGFQMMGLMWPLMISVACLFVLFIYYELILLDQYTLEELLAIYQSQEGDCSQCAGKTFSIQQEYVDYFIVCQTCHYVVSLSETAMLRIVRRFKKQEGL